MVEYFFSRGLVGKLRWGAGGRHMAAAWWDWLEARDPMERMVGQAANAAVGWWHVRSES